MTSIDIAPVPDFEHADTSARIETALLSSLADLNTQSTNTSIVLTAMDDDGVLVGGVSGSTSYGWFLVKLLWVDELCRGTGLGRQLMQAAEEEARRHECHSAWLDTSNPEAHRFYLGLGYVAFGVLENSPDQQPADHKRWFMKKRL